MDNMEYAKKLDRLILAVNALMEQTNLLLAECLYTESDKEQALQQLAEQSQQGCIRTPNRALLACIDLTPAEQERVIGYIQCLSDERK